MKIAEKQNMRLPYSYIDSVIKSGGVPLGIAVLNDDAYIDEVLNVIDGLLIPGGDDVNPKLYNEETTPYTKGIDDELDAFQIKLIQKALDRGTPILGICRGHQIINVALKGSLYQDISEMKESANIIHDQLKNGYTYEQTVHEVHFEKNSLLEKIYGEKMNINSFHHQVLKQLGNGLQAIGYTEDGVIEAIVSQNHPFVLGVQWHPERSEDQLPIFKLFIGACKK